MSKIEWTGITWNITAGCKEKSRGCRECYAARMAHRLAHIAPMKDIYAGLTKKLDNGRIIWTGKVITLENRLLDPVHIKKPTTIFVDSMSDLFHKDVPFEFIDKVMDFNKLNWRPTYKLQEVSFSIKSAPTDQGDKEILIIKAGSFHEEEFSIFQLMGKVPNLSLYHGNTKLICQTIFEYLLKNAMFPYPVEELY